MFANNTPYEAIDVPLMAPDGRAVVVAVVKATLVVGARGATLSEVPRPVRLNDVLYDNDAVESSVVYPTDVCVEKTGTDVLVVGHAVSPKPVAYIDVMLRVREREVPLRVHGARFFYRGVGDLRIGPAALTEREPIVYEKAYGGNADDGWIVEPRNRAGVGVFKHEAELVDKLAPQIEHPSRPHQSSRDAHPPVGYGAIRSHWSPRLELSGTFDAVWENTRMPIPPTDYDVRANNVAHPTLQFATPLTAGDNIDVQGMSLAGVLRFVLPALGVVVHGQSDITGRVARRPRVDTIVVEPESRMVELTMRAAFPQGRGHDVLREITVDLEDGARPPL